jgi:trigger factor
MQVSVETTSGLERRMTVQVPREEVDKQVEERLQSLTGEVRLDGFRPGKVPMRVVKQRFGGRVRQEVLAEVIQSSFHEAVTQENLRLAGGPTIDPVDDAEELRYTAVFEVYPEIRLSGIEGIEVCRPRVSITDDDVSKMIETLRRQRITWAEVERAAAVGDRLEVSFRGTMDGKVFTGGEAEHVPLELGSGAMFPGFEEGLSGANPGDTLVFNVVFPEDYPAAELAGKAAEFSVDVHSVSASTLPEVDAEFVNSFGVETGTVEDLQTNVRENMERELEQIVRTRTKEQVLDSLLEALDPDVPGTLVEEEAKRIREQLANSGMNQSQGADDLSAVEEQASRRVKRGVLLAEVIRSNELEAAPDQVRERLERLAASYGDSQEVINWYYANPEQLATVENLVVEENAIDWLLERMKVVEEPTTFDAMAHPGQGSP